MMIEIFDAFLIVLTLGIIVLPPNLDPAILLKVWLDRRG